MKAVVIGESAGATREAIMAVYPRHKAIVNQYIERGLVLGIGPFQDGGNMAVFKTREAAEAFSANEPFRKAGLFESVAITRMRRGQWNPEAAPQTPEGN